MCGARQTVNSTGGTHVPHVQCAPVESLAETTRIRPAAVLTVCCAAIVTMSFGTGGLALCMPAIARDLQLDYAPQGLVFSAVMWSFPLSLLAAGLADRIGFRGLLFFASLIQVGGWMLVAQSRTFSQAMWASALAGVGGSIVDPLLTPIVCAVYPRQRARMSNFLHGFYCVGLVAVVVAVILMQQAGLSWRWILRAMGVLCIPYGVASALLVLPRQAHHGQVRVKVRSLVSRPIFWLFVLAMLMAGATEMGPFNWLPTFVQGLVPGKSARMAELAAGAGTVLFGILMATGRFLTSARAGRWGIRPLLLITSSLCIICLAATALPLGVAYRTACVALVGLGVACMWPTLLAAAGDRFPDAGASMFSSLSAAGSLGCAAAPAVVGWVGQVSGSLPLAMASLTIAPVVILLATLGLKHRSPEPAPAAS